MLYGLIIALMGQTKDCGKETSYFHSQVVFETVARLALLRPAKQKNTIMHMYSL